MSSPDPDPTGAPSFTTSEASASTNVAVTATMTKHHRRHRTWPQRCLLGLNILVIIACFATAGGLLYSRAVGNSIPRIGLADPASTTAPRVAGPLNPSGSTVVDDTTATDTPGTSIDATPTETLPEADPEAKNFLITGADNNACIDPNSPYAGAFGNRESMGERSDTIMIMRVDPSTKRAAVLSFPRDLYVSIAGQGGKSRISNAYVRDNPTKLIGTIYDNFGLEVDHFIQIDFCAFKTIVDGLGGVAVPFDYAARDKNTGLNVPTAGCFTFDGDHALAYVRSRKYQYRTDDGKWHTDPVSDLGRISRQQDFLRRVLSSALDRGITDPGVAKSLIEAAQNHIVVDEGLTISRMLEFVGVLRNFDPGGIATYQIEAEGQVVSGSAVLIPRIKGDNMKAILAIFKGEAPLAGAPAQVFETTTTTPDATATTGPVTTDTVVGPEEKNPGIIPPRDVDC
jgi:LCP family protein required for cell wall assembly